MRKLAVSVRETINWTGTTSQGYDVMGLPGGFRYARTQKEVKRILKSAGFDSGEIKRLIVGREYVTEGPGRNPVKKQTTKAALKKLIPSSKYIPAKVIRTKSGAIKLKIETRHLKAVAKRAIKRVKRKAKRVTTRAVRRKR